MALISRTCSNKLMHRNLSEVWVWIQTCVKPLWGERLVIWASLMANKGKNRLEPEKPTHNEIHNVKRLANFISINVHNFTLIELHHSIIYQNNQIEMFYIITCIWKYTKNCFMYLFIVTVFLWLQKRLSVTLFVVCPFVCLSCY